MSAGFPSNEGLTKYIIDTLPFRNRTYPAESEPSHFQGRWKDTAKMLQRANCLSVDEFCEIGQPILGDGAALKQIVSVALFDKVAERKTWNEYVRFVASLFKQSEADLDDRFTVVSFNYDGLLGKMLLDAVRERRYLAQAHNNTLDLSTATALAGGWSPPHPIIRRDDTLIAHIINGGVPTPFFNVDSIMQAVESENFDGNQFCLHMPHGNFTVMKDRTGTNHAFQDLIYGDVDVKQKEAWFLDLFRNSWQPAIQFPWEKKKRLALHQRQIDHAALSVEEATRIHFIGLSGHPLLRHTLMEIFARVHPANFQSKEWFVATTEENKERVFRRLMDCFLPSELQGNEAVKAHISKPPQTKYLPSFDGWLNLAPHTNPQGYRVKAESVGKAE